MAKIAEIKEEIPIPENVEVTKENGKFLVTGEKGSLSRVFSHPNIILQVKDKSIVVTCKKPRRKDKACVGTFIAHIKNMIKGVTLGFEYKMKTVYSHFPIKTAVKGTTFLIHNFLGERSPRKARILEGVSVDIKGDDISVLGIDKEKVGQTVANIERAAAVKHRDVRVVQDGVYRVSKGDK